MYKIEKLPSGHFRVRRTYKGMKFQVTFEERPTKKEIEERFREMLQNETCDETRSFKVCAERYIASKTSSLSPSTIYCYKLLLRVIDQRFLNMPLNRIKQYNVQFMLNEYAKNHSPKSVHNLYGFVYPVIKMFIPRAFFNVSFPQKVRKNIYIPNDKDIKIILNELKGTEYEIPITLACFGLRRGEIMGLNVKTDVKPDRVIINKALIKAEKGYVLKPPKTYDSNREVIIPESLSKKIIKKGYIFNQRPLNLTLKLHEVQKKYGMPSFSLHKLRHYMASTCHMLGIPQIYTKMYGGWKSDVLEKIYTHPITSEYDKVFLKHFENLIG